MLGRFKLVFVWMLVVAAFDGPIFPSSGAAAEPMSSARLADRAEIQNLIMKYGMALDTLDADAYAGVFAKDAEFTFGGNTYNGRSEIRKIITDLQARRASEPAADPPVRMYHAISNTIIEFVSDDEVHHRSYWQTIRGPAGGPFTVGGMGVYEDVIVKRDGEWLIQKRQILN